MDAHAIEEVVYLPRSQTTSLTYIQVSDPMTKHRHTKPRRTPQ